MARGKISKRSADALKSSDRDEYLWDMELSGFGLKITPKGKRTYLVQYRLGGRKGGTRRYTIGAHGTLTPEQARVEAKHLLGLVAAGKDPAEGRDRERKALTVADVHVHTGGQAVVGVIETPGGGDPEKTEEHPHAKQIAHAPEPTLRSLDTEREAVPITSNGKRPLPDARK